MGRLSGRGRVKEFCERNELCKCHEYLFWNETLLILPVFSYTTSISFSPFPAV